jgi:hypothetical protein
MNVSSDRKLFSPRKLLSGVAGLILMAAPLLTAMPTAAAAGEPYGPPDDVAAYQAYAQQYAQPPHIARPVPPSEYPGQPNYVRRNQMESQLDYAQAQYNRARQAGDRAAARHWKKEIKHLKRELSERRRREGSGYGTTYPPPRQPYYGPPPSAYAPQSPEYPVPRSAYAQPYPPNMPPSGYAYPGAAPMPYGPSGYSPSAGYPNTAVAASPYGAPGATGPTGGLGTLLGPLLGTGAMPSAQQAGYPQAGYPATAAPAPPYGAPAASSPMGNVINSLIASMRGSGSGP